MLVSRERCLHAAVQPLEVESHVGAGDALLAGFLAVPDAADEERLRRAVAWGTAACTLPGTQMPGPDLVHPQEVTVSSDPDGNRPLAQVAASHVGGVA